MTPESNTKSGSSSEGLRYPLFRTEILEAERQLYVKAANLTHHLNINFPEDQSGTEEGKLTLDIRGREARREAFFNKVKELRASELESA